jgi:hypothetical protein
MKQLLILFSASMLALPFFSNAQGCSDAGFCTISSFQPDSVTHESHKNQIKIGAFYGKADHAIAAYGAYIEYNRELSKKWGLDVKLNSLAQNGNDISVFGISDILANVNYGVTENLKVTLGAKIPLSAADRTLDGLPLPMDYQSSLGTFDLIAGAGYKHKNWKFVGAVQVPLSQNSNAFFASLYPETSPVSRIQSTNGFTRAADAMVRVSYTFEIGEKFKLTPAVLPIYHLGEDTYVNELNQTVTIVGSDGLTLNANVFLSYALSDQASVEFNTGFPFIVRDARPDGLTRSYIFNLAYAYKF